MRLQFYADANCQGFTFAHFDFRTRLFRNTPALGSHCVCAVWYAYRADGTCGTSGARFVRCAVGYGYMSLPCVCVCSIRVGFTLSVPYDNGQHDHTLSVVQAGRSACVQAGGTHAIRLAGAPRRWCSLQLGAACPCVRAYVSHGLGLGWYNAVMRAPTAGLTGLGTVTMGCVHDERRGRMAVVVSLKTSVIGSCPVNSGDMAHYSRAVSRVRVTVVQRGDEASHGRSYRTGHGMGCVHDETGSGGSGSDPQERSDRFVFRQQWGHGTARATSVPSHGLGLGWYNAVTRPLTAGLTGLGTVWDVCTMRRGRMAVVVSL